MATRLPQHPKNLLEKVIFDADLDYLGRDDFPAISQLLKKEFLHYKIIPDTEAWNDLQICFPGHHRYQTHSSQLLRDQPKRQQLETLLSTS